MSSYPKARSEGMVSEEVGDELLIYDEATKMAHSLSKDAASVWRLCDGHSSAEDVAYRVGGLEQARVAQALDELSAAGLIEKPDGISRRTLYKRAAKLGAAALSAPLIYSVAIRPASAAASPLTCNRTSCFGTADPTPSVAKLDADLMCRSSPACAPNSTCNCTPQEIDNLGLYDCNGFCSF